MLRCTKARSPRACVRIVSSLPLDAWGPLNLIPMIATRLVMGLLAQSRLDWLRASRRCGISKAPSDKIESKEERLVVTNQTRLSGSSNLCISGGSWRHTCLRKSCRQQHGSESSITILSTIPTPTPSQLKRLLKPDLHESKALFFITRLRIETTTAWIRNQCQMKRRS
jgi:hypothetical protein